MKSKLYSLGMGRSNQKLNAWNDIFSLVMGVPRNFKTQCIGRTPELVYKQQVHRQKFRSAASNQFVLLTQKSTEYTIKYEGTLSFVVCTLTWSIVMIVKCLRFEITIWNMPKTKSLCVKRNWKPSSRISFEGL